MDPAVALFTSILRVVEIQNDFLKNNMGHLFSPEIAATVLWFLKRWTRGYMPGYSAQLKNSPVLNACFDVKKDCGKLILKVFLETAELNLYSWTGEPQVCEDVSNLLVRMFSDQKRYNHTFCFKVCLIAVYPKYSSCTLQATPSRNMCHFDII